jgi:hypothetical protein
MPGPAQLAKLREHRDAANIVAALNGKLPDATVTIQNTASGSEVRERGSVRLRTKPVAWAVPLDEIVFTRFFTNWLRLRSMPWDDLYTISSTYLPEARNTLHKFFVEESQCEHLVMLDSDVLPPPDFLERLLAHDKPLVGGWYRKKDEAATPCVYTYQTQEADGVYWWKPRPVPGVGLEQVDGAGAGCWLMRRDVAEALGPKPYDMNQGGEDLALCKRVTDLGFPIFIDWSIACAHAGVFYQ